MNPGESDEIDDLIAEELADYQAKLEAGLSTAEGTDFDPEWPHASDSELEQTRQCLELLHLSRSSFTSSSGSPNTASSIPDGTKRIGRFIILERLGFGGFGIVYRSLDPTVNREVAVKIPRPDVLISPHLITRFSQEARVAAQLDHPNIVPVYESGMVDVVPYLVTRFVSGPTLAKWRSGQAEIDHKTAARIVQKLAEAMAHAHDRGVLHRDLSAGNVLLEPCDPSDSETELPFVPQLTDFGLAKCVDQDQDKTRTGVVIGTLRSMAPEQIEGQSANITASADIYGLGVILYELLTGGVPFQAETDAQTIRMILQDEPRSIHTQRPFVPRDLEVICLKCLKKNPTQRYHTARELAEDLQHFLAGEPILARPASVREKLWRWGRRQPVLATLAAIAVIAVPVVMGISIWYNARFAELLANSRKLEFEVRRRAYASDVRMAQKAWDQGNIGETLKLLDRYVPRDDRPDARNFPWWYLWNQYQKSSRVLALHPGGATATAIAPNSSIGAAGGRDGLVRLWALPEGREIAILKFPEMKVIEALHFSPASSKLAIAGQNGVVCVWDVAAGQRVFQIQAHDGWTADVKFSPQGNLLASAGSDTLIKLWDPNTGKFQGKLSGHLKVVRTLAFHPTEQLLASGGEDDRARIWNLKTLQPDPRLDGGILPYPEVWKSDADPTSNWPRVLVFSPEADLIMAGMRSSNLVAWDARQDSFGKLLKSFSDSANPRCLSWVPGQRLTIGLTNSTIRSTNEYDIPLHDWANLRGHLDSVLSIAMASDGSSLLSASADGTVRIWSSEAIQGYSLSLSESLTSIGFDRPKCTENTVAFGDYPGQLGIFRIADGKQLFLMKQPASGAYDYSEVQGKLLQTDDANNVLTCRMIPVETPIWSIPIPAPAYTLQMNTTGNFAALPCGRELLIVDVEAAVIKHRLPHPDKTFDVCFLENLGEPPQVLCGCGDGKVRFWDIESGKLLRQFHVHLAGVRSVSLSKDRRFLGTGGEDRKARIWKLDDLTEIASFTHDTLVSHVEFLKDDMLVTRDNSLQFWSIADQLEMLSFPHYCDAGNFTVSQDGTKVFAQTGSRLRILDGAPSPADSRGLPP